MTRSGPWKSVTIGEALEGVPMCWGSTWLGMVSSSTVGLVQGPKQRQQQQQEEACCDAETLRVTT
jgi:hypothetical protein